MCVCVCVFQWIFQIQLIKKTSTTWTLNIRQVFTLEKSKRRTFIYFSFNWEWLTSFLRGNYMLWAKRRKREVLVLMKRSFFLAAIVSVLLYGCTTWMLTKRQEKRLDGNYTRMLWAILNRSWRQHPTKQQLYGHRPPVTKTIQIRRTRHAGHSWRNRDKLIIDVLLWTPSHGRAKAGRPGQTYIQQLCEDTGCSPEDLPEVMNYRKRWWERVRDIRADGTTWWWWWFSWIILYYFIFSELIP